MSKLKLVLFLFVGFLTSLCWSQEKFLEVSISPQDFGGNQIKDHEVIVTTLEGISFIINTEKKHTSFYLPPGEKYNVAVEKEGFHTYYYSIDLRDVPKELYKDGKQEIALFPSLYPKESDEPIPLIKYEYNDRYKKVALAQ